MENAVQIRLLGPLEICGARSGSAKPGRKTQALLGYLAADPRARTRTELFDFFCGDTEDPPASLRWHLHRIRRWLGSGIIASEGDRLRFNGQAAWIDCREFERALNSPPASAEASALCEAVDLFRGDFLANLTLPDSPEFELWLVGERARFRRLYELGLNELIARRIGREDYDAAVPLAVRLLQSNPILEQTHARLIWMYAKTGQRQAALEQYERCRELLRRELAVEPTPELENLHADVLAGRLGRSVPSSAEPGRVALDAGKTVGFVGRCAELETLASLWRAAGAGSGTAVCVEAEAGGGKTRLVREFMRSLDPAPPAGRLCGRCCESTRGLPYHPWIEILEARLAALGEEALRGMPPYWTEQLMRLLPALAGRRAGGTLSSPPVAGGEVEHLFAAVKGLLFGRSGSAPLLIFLDDMQWADESSLRLFHYLARRASAARALLIGAFRPEELDDAPALRSVLNDWRRDTLAELRLDPLNAENVSELIERLWPALPEGYRPHVCALLVKATRGNPFFVTEVLRELSGTVEVPIDIPVPSSVRALIGHRMEKLPESGRQVLQAIAVLDRPCPPDLARKISGRSDEEVVSAVDMGLRWGLLASDPAENPSTVGFFHDLVREAVLHQAGELRRRMLHRRTAGVLSEAAGAMPPAARSELAGRIFHHALRGEMDELILAWGLLAAEHDQRVHDYADALRAVEAATGALDRLETAGTVDTAAAVRHRMDLLTGRIEILGRLGRFHAQGPLLEILSSLSARHPSPRQSACVLLLRADNLARMNAYRRAVESAMQAHEKFSRTGDPASAAKCLFVAADAWQCLGENTAALRSLEEARALYRAAGDASWESLCLTQIGGTLLDLGRVEQAMVRLEWARASSERRGDLFVHSAACSWLGTAWIYYYNVEKIRFYAGETERLARTLENEFKALRAMSYYMVSEYLGGNWEEAQRLAERLYHTAGGMKDGWVAGWGAHFLGRIALAKGAFPAAEHWLKNAHAMRMRHGEVQNQVSDLVWLGRLELARRETKRASEYAEEAVRRMEALRPRARVWEAPDVYLFRAEAADASGHRARSKSDIQHAYRDLTAFARQIRDRRIRTTFFNAAPNRRLLAAHESGFARPYPG